MDTIGSRLKALRESVPDLTPQQLGKLAGLKSPAHVTMLETGGEHGRGARVSADTALSLAEVLGCTVEYLVRGEGVPPAAAVVAGFVNAARARVASQVAA